MKRTDLIRTLERAGCILIRHGGNHDWYRNIKTGKSQPIPDIAKSKIIAKHILKSLAS